MKKTKFAFTWYFVRINEGTWLCRLSMTLLERSDWVHRCGHDERKS